MTTEGTRTGRTTATKEKAKAPGGIGRFSAEEVALIQRTLMEGAPADAVETFIRICDRTGLDPLARQIYAQRRRGRDGDTWSTMLSIDGFRIVAERSGHYAGQLGPWWCGADGVWKDIWLAREAPVAAKVAVVRDDFKEPLTAVARYDAYAQTYMKDGKRRPSGLWEQMPDLMLAKCAEALALRRAFPQDLSGLYSPEEMAQATPAEAAPEAPAKAAPEANEFPTARELFIVFAGLAKEITGEDDPDREQLEQAWAAFTAIATPDEIAKALASPAVTRDAPWIDRARIAALSKATAADAKARSEKYTKAKPSADLTAAAEAFAAENGAVMTVTEATDEGA